MGDITEWMFERGLLDAPDDDQYDWDHEDAGGPVHQPRCKFCGSVDVTWIHTGVRWRLFDAEAKNPHRCLRAASVDDFDDLTERA